MEPSIKELLSKWQFGTLTKQECKVLERWYNAEFAKRDLPHISAEEMQSDLQSLQDVSFLVSKRRSQPTYYLVAAAVVIFLFGFWLYPSLREPAAEAITVGGNRAILTLSDGVVVDLEKLAVDSAVYSSGLKIEKIDEGTIQYMATGGVKVEEAYDEVFTPKGGEFKVVLLDGTKVWLNNKSKLKIALHSDALERKVWLDGEGYFDVAHNAEKPFYVHSKQQEVRVLGTKFNMKTSDVLTETTLVSGKVSINKGVVVLNPGQQLTTINHKNQQVQQVDKQPFVAWKDGYFLFNYETLETVMQKIENWYDVEVEFASDLKKEPVWATISKFRNIEEVLSLIEQSGVAKFTIKERRVIVDKHD